MAVHQPQIVDDERSVRVAFPARVSFAGKTFVIHEFTDNLSQNGIFLRTEHMVPPGSQGRLTFRISQWDDPFDVEAEVVRVVLPDRVDGLAPGLGIRFINLDDENRKHLERLVSGVRDGSVVEAIRRHIRENHTNLLDELRRRPADQKAMLAVGAIGEEIDALIRDANPTAVLRLLDNPQLKVHHLREILKDRRTTTQFFLALKRIRRWMADEEVRFLYAKHRNAVLGDAIEQVRSLSVAKLRALQTDMQVRMPIRATAQEVLNKRSRGFTV